MLNRILSKIAQDVPIQTDQAEEEEILRREFGQRSYTRFPKHETRQGPCAQQPVQQAPSRPVAVEAPAPAPHPMAATGSAALHSEEAVSVDVLRRALPDRFREIDTAEQFMDARTATQDGDFFS